MRRARHAHAMVGFAILAQAVMWPLGALLWWLEGEEPFLGFMAKAVAIGCAVTLPALIYNFLDLDPPERD